MKVLHLTTSSRGLLWLALLSVVLLLGVAAASLPDVSPDPSGMECEFWPSGPQDTDDTTEMTICLGDNEVISAHVNQDLDSTRQSDEDEWYIEDFVYRPYDGQPMAYDFVFTNVNMPYPQAGRGTQTLSLPGLMAWEWGRNFSSDEKGSFIVTATVNDTFTPSDPSVAHNWLIHVVDSIAPAAQTGVPYSPVKLIRVCNGYYLSVWSGKTPCQNAAGSCSAGTCSNGAPKPPLLPPSAGPNSAVAPQRFAPDGPLPGLTTSGGIGDVLIFGVFQAGDTIDFYVDGVHYSGGVSNDGKLDCCVTITAPGQVSTMVCATPEYGNADDDTFYTPREEGTKTQSGVSNGMQHRSASDRTKGRWEYKATDIAHPFRMSKVVKPDGTVLERTFEDDTNGNERVTSDVLKSDDTAQATVLSTTTYGYDPSSFNLLTSVTSGTKTTLYEYGASSITAKEVHRSDNWPTTADVVYSETEYQYSPASNGVASTTVTQKALDGPGENHVTVYNYYLTSDYRKYQLESVVVNGATTSYTYNEVVERSATAIGPAHSYAQLATITDPQGNVTTYTYVPYTPDSPGDPMEWQQPVSKVEVSHDTTLLASTEYGYYMDTTVSPANPRWLKWTKDVRGNYTYYERNLSDHPELVRSVKVATALPSGDDWSAIPALETYAYYGDSSDDGNERQLLSTTVPNADGNNHDCVTTYKYGETVDSVLRKFDDPVQVLMTNVAGTAQTTVSTTTHDKAGRVLSSTDADNRTTWYRYDAQGRPTLTIYKFIDANSNGVPDYILNPDTGDLSVSELAAYTQNFYSCCNLLWSKDENGHKTYYDYDDMKRVTKTWTDISGQSSEHPLASCEYDAFGNQHTVTTYSDAGHGRATTGIYDEMDRLTRVNHPTGLGYEECGYDVEGNVQWVRDGNGNVTLYKYDSHGRPQNVFCNYTGSLTSITYPSTADVTCGYEGNSSLMASIVQTNPSLTSSYTYDTLGRLETYTPPVGLGSGYHLEYAYNDAGQKKEVKITNGTSTPYDVTYDYFANGLLKEVKNLGTNVASYTYNAVGNRTVQTNRNGTSTEYAYDTSDPSYLLDSITHKHGTTELAKFDYAPTGYDGRDAAGNPRSIEDRTGVWSYGYDAISRLTTAVPPNPIPDQPAGGPYGYDWVGNRLNPSTDSNHMAYNAADQLTSWPGMYSYHYDAAGNLQQVNDSADTVGLRSYTYWPDGLLHAVTRPSNSMSHTWDATGNRGKLTVNGNDYSFVYDVYAGVPAVLEEQGPDKSYYYIRTPSGILIARVDASSGASRYYHYDETGSTRLLTDANGNVTDTYAYDAYGSVVSHNGSTADNPYQYVGALGYYTHYQDPDFGLLQLGFRFYDPRSGRFTQLDPIGDGLNWYAYAAGNPMGWLDPWGLQAEDCDPREGLDPRDDELEREEEFWARDRRSRNYSTAMDEYVDDLLKLDILENAEQYVDDVVSIYFGHRGGQPVYVGITNDLARRQSEYGDRFNIYPITGFMPRAVGKGIETAIIELSRDLDLGFENQRRSIGPRNPLYDPLVRRARDRLGNSPDWIRAIRGAK